MQCQNQKPEPTLVLHTPRGKLDVNLSKQHATACSKATASKLSSPTTTRLPDLFGQLNITFQTKNVTWLVTVVRLR